MKSRTSTSAASRKEGIKKPETREKRFDQSPFLRRLAEFHPAASKWKKEGHKVARRYPRK